MINPSKVAATMVMIACALLILAFLTGCETLGVSLETDYGRFTYQLPELPSRTLRDK
jgi:hypothetical protein